MSGFLPINEYSNKYKISISTIRRRIRGQELEFRMVDGKYLVQDKEPEVENRGRRISASHDNRPRESQHSQEKQETNTEPVDNHNSSGQHNEPSFSTTHRLLDELKKAYSQILAEKEEQIISLKEEISDLRTLVRVLENENARITKARQT